MSFFITGEYLLKVHDWIDVIYGNIEGSNQSTVSGGNLSPQMRTKKTPSEH